MYGSLQSYLLHCLERLDRPPCLTHVYFRHEAVNCGDVFRLRLESFVREFVQALGTSCRQSRERRTVFRRERREWRPVRPAFRFRDVCVGRSYAYAPLIVQEEVSMRLYLGRRGRYRKVSSS